MSENRDEATTMLMRRCGAVQCPKSAAHRRRHCSDHVKAMKHILNRERREKGSIVVKESELAPSKEDGPGEVKANVGDGSAMATEHRDGIRRRPLGHLSLGS